MLKGLLKVILIFIISLSSIKLCYADAGEHTGLQLKRSEIIKLPRKKADERIHTLTISLRGKERTIELIPYSVKSKKFKVLVEKNGKLVTRKARKKKHRIFRGYIPSMPGAIASVSYCQGEWYIRILLEDGEEYWLEPLAHQPVAQGSASGATTDEAEDAGCDHVLYQSKDVITEPRLCHSIQSPETIRPISTELANDEPNNDNLIIANIACDADYEFFVSRGSDIDATVARIESIINTVNVQYERDVGITHRISAIIVRSNRNDPYTKSHSHDLINEFKTHWIYNHSEHIDYDLAHLFTGRDLQGSSAGVSYVGSVCRATPYGLSEGNFSRNYGEITNLVAHEIGHSWGAEHCNCPNNTMHTYTNSSNVFSAHTIQQILDFRDSRTCLNTVSSLLPQTPTDLDAIAVNYQTINISWVDNATTELGTVIERSMDGKEWATVATVAENVTEYQDVGLAPATTYLYRVNTYNISGESDTSNLAFTLTPEAPYLFAGDSPLQAEGDWYSSPWLGQYWGREGPWFYHYGMGFICVAAASAEDDFWFWHLDRGWVWTNNTIWPYCYIQDRGTWYYYKTWDNGESYFYKVKAIGGIGEW